MRVLTWNLYHGRAVPPAGRSLEAEFRAALEGWAWDVALLQEVPPWWPERWPWPCDVALTSRNWGLPVRRALASRWPDLVKSNGGGANAILVRDGTPVAARRSMRLRWWPEQRVAHGVLLGDHGWVVNLHAQVHSDARARADLARAAATWADAPLAVVGGDLNVRAPAVAGLLYAGGHGVDHVLARGWAGSSAETLERGALSDHAPVLVTLTRQAG